MNVTEFFCAIFLIIAAILFLVNTAHRLDKLECLVSVAHVESAPELCGTSPLTKLFALTKPYDRH